MVYSVSQIKITPDLWFTDIFSQTVQNFKSVFTHLLCVPIYAILQIFYSVISSFNEVMPY